MLKTSVLVALSAFLQIFDPNLTMPSLLHVLYSSCFYILILKKNQNTPRPSEHPPVRGENIKTFRWDHRLQIQNLFMAFKRVPLSMVVTLGQQCNTGANPTVILYTYINRHAGTPEKQRRQNSTSSNIIIYNNNIGYKYEFTTALKREQRVP